MIADGGYDGMSTFDQSLLGLVKAGKVAVEAALRRKLEPARLHAAAPAGADPAAGLA